MTEREKKRGKKKEVAPAAEAEKKGLKVTIVSNGDDWNGLYLDGVLVQQGHEVSVRSVLKALGIECEEVWCDNEWLEGQGELPAALDEVVRE